MVGKVEWHADEQTRAWASSSRIFRGKQGRWSSSKRRWNGQAMDQRGQECRLALPKSVRQWSLTTLKEKLVKIGAKVTRHAKYVTFQLAEVAVPRQLFASILKRIGRLCQSPALCPSG